MVCKKPEIPSSLPCYIRRYISRSARYTDTVVKGDLMVKKGIQNSCIVSAFHSASFYYQPDFLLFLHSDLLLFISMLSDLSSRQSGPRIPVLRSLPSHSNAQ